MIDFSSAFIFFFGRNELENEISNFLRKNISFDFFRSLNLELVTNAMKMTKVSHVQSNAIYAKDYYVLIMDDYDKVCRMLTNLN